MQRLSPPLSQSRGSGEVSTCVAEGVRVLWPRSAGAGALPRTSAAAATLRHPSAALPTRLCTLGPGRVVLEVSLLTRGDTRSCPFVQAKNAG